MRKFEVTLTYKPQIVKSFKINDKIINQQKVIDVELDDAQSNSPEQFCNYVINPAEKNDIVRINIKENRGVKNKPLIWLCEHYGRLYLINGVPLVFHRN